MSRRVLVNQLEIARESFGGIGTKQIKLNLNRLVKSCPIAKAFRIALEIEDCSTLGKKYRGDWSNHYYEKKDRFIKELIEIFKTNDWVYGIHLTNGHPPTVIYFEIPGCEQISFHCFLDRDKAPEYKGEWDGKRNSTFGKLEKAICDYFDSARHLPLEEV